MTAAGAKSATPSSRSSAPTAPSPHHCRPPVSTSWSRLSAGAASWCASRKTSAPPSSAPSAPTGSGASTSSWIPPPTAVPAKSRWPSDAPRACAAAISLKVTFLVPHLRIAGGVRAILTYAGRLAARGHEVTLVVPARGRLAAARRNRRGRAPNWMPGLRARIVWVARWAADALPDGDAIVATAWQSAGVVAAAPDRLGGKRFLVQHYQSPYHGGPAA